VWKESKTAKTEIPEYKTPPFQETAEDFVSRLDDFFPKESERGSFKKKLKLSM